MIRDDFYNHSYFLPIEVAFGYESISKFIQCPVCITIPRIWAFDNGKYAKCNCFDRFEQGIKATDIMTHYHKNGGDLSGYSGNEELIENWNNHIRHRREICQMMK